MTSLEQRLAFVLLLC